MACGGRVFNRKIRLAHSFKFVKVLKFLPKGWKIPLSLEVCKVESPSVIEQMEVTPRYCWVGLRDRSGIAGALMASDLASMCLRASGGQV